MSYDRIKVAASRQIPSHNAGPTNAPALSSLLNRYFRLPVCTTHPSLVVRFIPPSRHEDFNDRRTYELHSRKFSIDSVVTLFRIILLASMDLETSHGS